MTAEKKPRPNLPKVFKRKIFRPRASTMVAYDLETTNIKAYPYMESDNDFNMSLRVLSKELKKAGGVSFSVLPELHVTRREAVKCLPRLFKSDGLSSDELQSWMREHGWIREHDAIRADDDEVGGAIEMCYELLRVELYDIHNNRHPDDIERIADRLRMLDERDNLHIGTPTPLYVTAYGLDGEFRVAEKLTCLEDLLEVLALQFLIPTNDGYRFVGWNANNFDVYLVARALLLDPRYEMRPYMTRSKSLRGMRVKDLVSECEWEFLDGIAMTGCMMKLEKFLEKFAPDLPKMSGVIDFEAGEEFDATKQSHCEYAMRDSVGLYHALQAAQVIVRNTFGEVLRPTVGNMGIRIFQSHIPKNVAVQPLRDEVDQIMRDYVMRGGYCYCARRYTGKVWKYDINQAYAAAMREAWLPDGYAQHVSQYWGRYPGIYHLTATNFSNKIPFYYTDTEGDRIFGMHHIGDTWLTSIEVDQLKAEGWIIKITEGYLFEGRFKMLEYVDKLEHIRMNADGGSNGAVGTMMKSIGNNSYGKTVEKLDGVEYILAMECPVGFLPFIVTETVTRQTDILDEDGEPVFDTEVREVQDLPVWLKKNEPTKKEYHKPQIGSFITADVRMKVRRAALLDPEAWLYADTDCVVFSREPKGLDVHPSRYGAWKVECEGEEYRIITKKVYAKVDNTEKHAKGMNVKKLSAIDFEKWSRGEVPVQTQLHKNNLMKVLAGADMYIERVRRGTKIKVDS